MLGALTPESLTSVLGELPCVGSPAEDCFLARAGFSACLWWIGAFLTSDVLLTVFRLLFSSDHTYVADLAALT